MSLVREYGRYSTTTSFQMGLTSAQKDFLYYTKIIQKGTITDLEELAELDDHFPYGEDPLINTRWILHALGIGPFDSIRWMLAKKVELNFRDAAGETPVQAAIERDNEDRYEVLVSLLEAGADVNIKGQNDWTPAHLAAVRNDVEALKILVAHGADLTIKTEIDDYTTPLEEARILNKHSSCSEAISFLESQLGLK